MDYHQNARLTVHSREQLARLVAERSGTLKAAAAAFNVSAKTAAKWVRRYRERGRAGLADLSSRPHRCPRQTPSILLEKVFQLRRQRLNGCHIAREPKLSRATVSRILRRAGMNRLRSLDPPPPVIRYEHKRPGDLVHFDIKRLARIRRPGHRVTGDRRKESRGVGWEYLHIAIDDHSRIAFSAILPDQSHHSAMRSSSWPGPFMRLRHLHPTRVDRQRLLLQALAVSQAAPSSACETSLHRPYTPAPMARPNASSKPPCASGPTPAPTTTHSKGNNSSNSGCTNTTSTDHTPALN